MTLRELAVRSAQILKDMPQLADLPVYVSVKRSRITTEYVPIKYGCGSTLGIGQTDMVEFTTDARGLIRCGRKITTPNCI